jgi:hypothetical protein
MQLRGKEIPVQMTLAIQYLEDYSRTHKGSRPCTGQTREILTAHGIEWDEDKTTREQGFAMIDELYPYKPKVTSLFLGALFTWVVKKGQTTAVCTSMYILLISLPCVGHGLTRTRTEHVHVSNTNKARPHVDTGYIRTRVDSGMHDSCTLSACT